MEISELLYDEIYILSLIYMNVIKQCKLKILQKLPSYYTNDHVIVRRNIAIQRVSSLGNSENRRTFNLTSNTYSKHCYRYMQMNAIFTFSWTIICRHFVGIVQPSPVAIYKLVDA